MSGRYHHPPRKVQDDYVLSEKVLGSGFAGNVVLATSRRQQKSRFVGVPGVRHDLTLRPGFRL